MAKDLQTEEQKKAAKDKKANEKASLRAAAAKKPRKSPIKYFKDARSEFKKVVWPSRKQVFNNTVVVLVSIIVSGVAIWGLDTLFNALWLLILQRG